MDKNLKKDKKSEKNILVTGGAGYIGSVAVKDLVEQGHWVVVVDNLSRGNSLLDYIQSVAKFYKVDIAKEKDRLQEVFAKHNFDAVIHFAAYKSVEESMENPEKYKDNVIGTENLLDLISKYNVKKIIFSSSAAVYKPPLIISQSPIFPTKEDDSLGSSNIYGETKLQCEEKIQKFCLKYGITYINLRYFNVAGDGGLNYVDPRPENVFSIIMETLIGKRNEFVIFGKDYPTKDGTCIRDYIHVNDLVRAHILALDIKESTTINLGTSKGYSVLELVNLVEKVMGEKLNYRFGQRREGDPVALVASYEKAKKILDWQPEKGIREMISSAFKVYNKLKQQRTN